MKVSDRYICTLHTHMDVWQQMDSRVWAGAADADRTDAKRAGTDSKTFLCPQLQDRAVKSEHKLYKLVKRLSVILINLFANHVLELCSDHFNIEA